MTKIFSEQQARNEPQHNTSQVHKCPKGGQQLKVKYLQERFTSLLPLAMMVQGDSTSACSLGYEPNVLAPNSSPIIRGDIVWKWESHIMAFDACSNHYPVI